MAGYRKVTICLPIEIWGEDLDGDIGKLSEIAGAVGEVVTDYVESAIGVSVVATGEAVVHEGWEAA